MAYPNGQIPTSALTPLSTGGYLLAPVAAAFEELRLRGARAGFTIALTSVGDAYRSLERQIKVFRERYSILPFPEMGPFGDVRPWDSNGNGVKERWVRVTGASAAIPGTSNHGLGLAVDIAGTGGFSGPLYRWLTANAPALGWSNAEGRKVDESWHWVHSGAWIVSNPIGGGSVTIPTLPGAPAPVTPEDDMTPLEMLNAQLPTGRTVDGKPEMVSVAQALRAIYFYGDLAHDEIGAVPDRVWGAMAPHPLSAEGKQVTMRDFLRYVPAEHQVTRDVLVSAITTAVASIPDLDPTVVEGAVARGLSTAFRSIRTETTLTIDIPEDAS